MAIGRSHYRNFRPRNRGPMFPGSRLVADLIAERLSQCDEPIDSEWGLCMLCGSTEYYVGLDGHRSTCPWRMAKELHPA